MSIAYRRWKYPQRLPRQDKLLLSPLSLSTSLSPFILLSVFVQLRQLSRRAHLHAPHWRTAHPPSTSICAGPSLRAKRLRYGKTTRRKDAGRRGGTMRLGSIDSHTGRHPEVHNSLSPAVPGGAKSAGRSRVSLLLQPSLCQNCRFWTGEDTVSCAGTEAEAEAEFSWKACSGPEEPATSMLGGIWCYGRGTA